MTDEERAELTAWVRQPTTEQRMAQRARMVLAAAAGTATKEIASHLSVRLATVSKWRSRFMGARLAGLADGPRTGKPVVYGEAAERRILARLDEPPPSGFTSWTGSLLAQALGDIPKAQVWRMLRGHGISLQRRRNWCLSTDPQFSQKAADIVGLYLNPPEHAVVISVDEKPAIQVLERAQGWLRLPNGRALRGQSFEYKRHGTTTLFAALNAKTSEVIAQFHQRHRSTQFREIWYPLDSGSPNR